MSDISLTQAANRLDLSRPSLIRRMRKAGLLNARAKPLHPVRDSRFLFIRHRQWLHPKLGTMSSYTTRITPAGLRWVAEKIGLSAPTPPAEPDRRLVD
ncbi:hypothetical protein FQZ97_414220 [compost metagenome]